MSLTKIFTNQCYTCNVWKTRRECAKFYGCKTCYAVAEKVQYIDVMIAKPKCILGRSKRRGVAQTKSILQQFDLHRYVRSRYTLDTFV